MNKSKKPVQGLPEKEFEAQVSFIKKDYNLFWDEVLDGFIREILEEKYRDPGFKKRLIKWLGGEKEKSVALELTDMVTDPFILTFSEEGFRARVVESLPGDLCFSMKTDKVTFMSIGYGSLHPLMAMIRGFIYLEPLFPLGDKLFFYRALRRP